MKDQVTYSLYEFKCGNLYEFGNHSKRVKYKSIDEALAYVKSHIEHLSKVNRTSADKFFDKQILIVEYTGPYQSKIVGMITKDVISVAPWLK